MSDLFEVSPARDVMVVGGAFDGASRTDTALSLWAPALQSADAEILPEKPQIDARVRDTMRNDAFVEAGVSLHRDSVVGSMFLLNAKPAGSVLGKAFDDTWAEEFQEEVETKFGLYAESPDNWMDDGRVNGLTEAIRLGVGVFVFSGEYLEVAEWRRDGMRPFSTTFRAVDLDRLSTPPTETGNPLIRGGVEFDLNGAPRAYHIRKAHPTDWHDPENWIWKRVEARKPWGRLQVNHVLEQKRVAQSRGVSAMVTALKELRVTKRFRDIVLQNAVVNATFAASIESELPTEQIFQALGGVNTDPTSVQAAIDAYGTGFLGAIQDYTKGSRNLHLDGVKIPHFFPGTKLNIHKPGEGGPLGTEFEQSLLRYIASALNVSYEELSRDYSKTNYSSNRAASGVTWKSMQSRKRICADRIATVRYRLWLEEAINKRLIDSVPAAMRERGFIYEGQNFDALSACEWIGAGRGQVDELKETQAAGLRLKLGLSTREREIARISGSDWRADIRQMAREQRYAERWGVVLNADAESLNAANGTARDAGDGAEDDKEAA